MRALTKEDQGWHRNKIEGVDTLSYLSKTKCSLLLESHRHFEWSYFLGNFKKKTEAMGIGDHLDMCVQDENYLSKLVVMPKFSGKGMKAKAKEWKAAAPQGAIIVKQDTKEQLFRMVESLQSHPEAMAILKNCKKQLHGYAYDPELDIWFYFIPDLLHSGYVADVKATDSAKGRVFATTSYNFDYHVQDALYLKGASLIFKKPMTQFINVVVEYSAPYITEVYEVPQSYIFAGDGLIKRATKRFKECLEWKKKNPAGRLPGYSGKFEIASLETETPSWILTNLEKVDEAYA